MAASESSTAQDIMICDVCERSPVQMHCNLCVTNLCEGCIAKHISKDPSKDHTIVIFKRRNIKPIFPKCKNHKDENCEMQCQQCTTNICIKCLSSHRKHELVDLMELCNAQKDVIQEKTKHLQMSIYPKYEKAISETETQISNLNENHEKLMTSITDQEAKWHREIDVIVNRLKTEAEKMRCGDLETLQKHLSELKTILSELHQAILENKKLLKLNSIEEILNRNNEMSEFGDPPEKTLANPTFIPLPVQGEQLYKLFGNLTTDSLSLYATETTAVEMSKSVKPLLDSAQCINMIESGCTELYAIACLNPDQIWVRGNDGRIKCFNHQGSLQQNITSSSESYEGITVSPQGNLIYTQWSDIDIYITRNGEPKKMITVGHEDWQPEQVCSTGSENLLVSMWRNQKKKVVQYKGSKEKKTIQFDKAYKSLFSNGEGVLFIDENRNGDLCVSDEDAKQVLVLDQDRNLRFRYTGNLSCNKYKSFNPRGIVTDSECHILIADKNNNCIHIISEDGQFIRYIDNCQLSKPRDLSLDKNNTLYVAELNTGKVKMIQYMA